MGIREEAISRGAGTLIFDPRRIEEMPGYNTRDMESEATKAHIRGMADAIKENGNDTFPPITIYQEGEHIYVMAGWCRRRAHILAMEEGAEVKGILCMNAGKRSPEEMALDVLSSNDGLPLTPLEKAQAVKRLRSFMWSVEEIAKRRGWSVSTVRNLLALVEAPEPVKEMVRTGEVSATQAVSEMRKAPDKAPEKIREAVDRAKSEGKEKATGRHFKIKRDREDPIEGIKKIISTLSNADFERLNEWITSEMERRES